MLPPELFDAIIWQARDDLQALGVCALVCKSWLASSRHHTFSHFVFVLRPDNADDFLDLILARHATLPPYIVRVELVSDDWSRGYHLRWLSRVIDVLATLPSLTVLRVENISWNALSAPARAGFLIQFQRLTHLELRACDFNSFANLCRLVASKPALQSLLCDDLGWEDPQTAEDAVVPSTLSSLRLSGCYERDVLNWLVAQPRLPVIRHLELGAVSPPDTAAIGNFLRQLGPSLKLLQFAFWSLDPGGDAEDFCAHVDLSHNTRLDTIVLDKFIHYSTYRFSSAIGWIPQLLSRSRSLRRVFLGVSILSISELSPEDDPIDWAALDNIFCSLATLCFRVLAIVELAEIAAVIKLLLPKCAARNDMLQFVSRAEIPD
uniref:F-box domain-containing protein n=1 Tax=Mycena chlorophos TaxID=658473 RepID=A0ABQ0LCU7_MYCCL|nr:predicted protein [Mycena chlorophos]